jgi:colanic acid biosynthesis glycosyl transferase WcaI
MCRPRVIAAAPESNEAALMVKGARAGLVVSPEDTKSLIAAAECLLSNKRLCAEYGVNARPYAKRTFGITGIADRYLAAFGPVPIASAATEMELERAGNR